MFYSYILMVVGKGKERIVFEFIIIVSIAFDLEFGILNNPGNNLKLMHGFDKERHFSTTCNVIGKETPWIEKQKGGSTHNFGVLEIYPKKLSFDKHDWYLQMCFSLGCLLFYIKKRKCRNLEIFILLIIFSNLVIGTHIGYNTIGGSGLDRAHKFIKTENGDYLVAGSSTSRSLGTFDAFLMRINSTFSLISIKYFGFSDTDLGESVCSTNNGGSAIAGTTVSTTSNKYYAFVLRFDKYDNLVWFDYFGGKSYDCAYGIISLSNGNLIVVGNCNSQPWIFALDSSNNILFSQIAKTSTSSSFIKVDALSNEDLIAAGWIGSGRSYIAKYTSSGLMLWAKQYGSSSYRSRFHSIIVGSNSNIFACGWSSYYMHYFFVITDSEGHEIRSLYYGKGGVDDSCRALANLPDKNYAAVGYNTNGEYGGMDGWVMKITYEGTILFYFLVGGTGEDCLFGVIGENDGGYTGIGCTYSFSSLSQNVYIIGGYFGCEPGYYKLSGVCTCCPAGTYNPYCGGTSISACISCPTGTYSLERSIKCTNCSAGTANPNIGSKNSSVCLTCSAGTYAEEGSSECTKCPAGTANSEKGSTNSTSCLSCSSGTYSLIGSSNCISCPAGTYNPKSGGTSISACIICSTGTYSSSKSANYTVCPAETYNSNTGSSSSAACLPCPSKMTSSQGSALCFVCNCEEEYVCRRGGCLVKNLGLHKCSSLENCADNNSTRSVCDDTCKCNTGYFWCNSRKLCVPSMDGTYFCNQDSNCLYFANNVRCNGFCICASSYTWSKSRHRCLAENVGKSPCTSIDDCLDNGISAICDEKCSCINGYVYNYEEERCIKRFNINEKEIYKEILTLVVIFVFLLIINIWSIVKDKFEFVENVNIDDLANNKYRANPQINEKNMPQINIPSSRNEFCREEEKEKKEEEKQKESTDGERQKEIEEDELLFWGRISLKKLLIRIYLRSHELLKIFIFSSPSLSRNSRAIIFCLQVQTASCSLILFNMVLCPNASAYWQIIASFYITLPIKWGIEYLLRYTCDTRTTPLLVSSSTIEEIKNIIKHRLSIQSIIRGIGQFIGYCLICISFISAIYFVYVIDYNPQDTFYFYILFMILSYLLIHQCLVALAQFILIRIYGPSYTRKDLNHPSFLKSFIMREIIEDFLP